VLLGGAIVFVSPVGLGVDERTLDMLSGQ